MDGAIDCELSEPGTCSKMSVEGGNTIIIETSVADDIAENSASNVSDSMSNTGLEGKGLDTEVSLLQNENISSEVPEDICVENTHDDSEAGVSGKRKAKIVGMLKSLSKYKDCEENFDEMFKFGSPKKNTRLSKSPKKEDRNSSLHEFLESELPFIKSIVATQDDCAAGKKTTVSCSKPPVCESDLTGSLNEVSTNKELDLEETDPSPKKSAKKKKKKGKHDLSPDIKPVPNSPNSNEALQVSLKTGEIEENDDNTMTEVTNSGKKTKKQKNKLKEHQEVYIVQQKGKNKHKKAFESSTDEEELMEHRQMGSYSQLLQKMGNPHKGSHQSQKQKIKKDTTASDENRFVPIHHPAMVNNISSASSPQSDDSQKQKKKKKNKSPDTKPDPVQRPNSANKKGKGKKKQEAPTESLQGPCQGVGVQTEMRVKLPKCDHKYVVGAAGRHLTEIFQMTGVTIDVPPLYSGSDEILLKGDQLQLGPAVAIMFSKSQQLKMEMMQKQQQGARPKDGGPVMSQGYNKGQGQDEGHSPYQSNKKSKKSGAMYEPELQQQLQRPYPGQFVRQNSNRSQDSSSPRGGKHGQSQADMYGQNYGRGQHQKGVKGQGQKQKYAESPGQRQTPGDHRCKTPDRGQGQGSTPKSQGKRQRNKKFQFADYISDQELSDGLKRGILIQGPVRINPKNFEESYVPHPDGQSDVMIESLKDRNRALNGDIVAIQICDQGEWKLNKDELQNLEDSFQSQLNLNSGEPGEEEDADIVIESEETVEIVAAPHTPPSMDKNAESLQTNTPPSAKSKKKGEKKEPPKKRFTSVTEVMTGGSPIAKKILAGDGSPAAKRLIQRTGKVVAIIEKKHSRAASGFIKLQQDRGADKALFYSNDYRMPRVLVPFSCCPKDFLERPDDYAKTLYVCRITDWRQDSVYADGILAKSLGEAGEIEPETEGMLIENGVDFNEFPQEALDCLPQQLPWSIPEQEFEYRRDFRSACVFTIDPATARDLDDALSCEDLGNGRYKVGVHIADVSYFLHEGNLLDRVAALRSTSVYLVHKVIPMLPRLLCEQLCSLNPNEDRLTFSVEWIISEDGEIEEEWFGRSVIRSCTKLAYEHAQGFIEQPDREWTAAELPAIAEYSIHDIKSRVLNLHKIAVNLRKARHDGGALRLDQVKLQYSLDQDSGMPNGYTVFMQKDSNRLVEEFMLLANMAVAHRINSKFPDKAFLRRHPPPQEKMIDTLKEQCEALGIFIDTSSAGGIQRSLRHYSGDDVYAAARMQVLTALCSKPMQNAKYFCAGCIDDENEYRHYALNVPLYTHFTSPIRRYPDVIVHRLLGATLGYCDAPIEAAPSLQRLAEHCNDKKTNAKRVGDLSCELFFAVFIKTAGPLEERAMVMGVLDKAFDIFVLRLGVTKRVYCDKLQLREKIYKRERKVPSLVLVWNTEQGEPAVQQEITIFSVVDCVLQVGDQPLQWTAVIKRPPPPPVL